MKIRPVETELFHAGRQTERHGEANSLARLNIKPTGQENVATFSDTKKSVA
jgi:hypothetical protein